MWQYRSFSSLNVKQCKFLELQWENGWLLWVSFLNRLKKIFLYCPKKTMTTHSSLLDVGWEQRRNTWLFIGHDSSPIRCVLRAIRFRLASMKAPGAPGYESFLCLEWEVWRKWRKVKGMDKTEIKDSPDTRAFNRIPYNVLILWLFYTWPNYRLLTLNGADCELRNIGETAKWSELCLYAPGQLPKTLSWATCDRAAIFFFFLHWL